MGRAARRIRSARFARAAETVRRPGLAPTSMRARTRGLAPFVGAGEAGFRAEPATVGGSIPLAGSSFSKSLTPPFPEVFLLRPLSNR